jgi:3-dehydro-L-gulonate 2-dehydrogenase
MNKTLMSVMRIPYPELHDVLQTILVDTGFAVDRAELCAQLFADASRDGVQSHGLNRFPRFIEMIKKGVVDIHATPELVGSRGSLEQWDGRRGAGNLNAHACMSRAISLARAQGVGCVALRNTNHWMRGGNYGWQAADAGMIGVCWTNTMPNLPPWASSEPVLGNNPLVIAVPRSNGHVVLDMAMSQFSYGALEACRQRGEQLPVIGGFDIAGELTREPGAIETSQRALPIGFWKGSGLALMLDLVASLLAGGASTHEIPADVLKETNLSQTFIAFAVPDYDFSDALANRIVGSVLSATPAGNESVRYPGERTLEVRAENMEKGIPVDPGIWEKVRAM